MPSPPRVIGTTEAAIATAESEVGRRFPPSFRRWLALNNSKGLDAVRVFPVLDERDKRKTWDSISRQHKIWQSYCTDTHPDGAHGLQHLLPFAEFGTGDYYCFDYSTTTEAGEVAVVHWSHETGSTSPRASSFTDFAERLQRGDFDSD
jgi:cell wall assembly regulator SMI1